VFLVILVKRLTPHAVLASVSRAINLQNTEIKLQLFRLAETATSDKKREANIRTWTFSRSTTC